MLYKIITPGSTLPCVSLYFKMKVRKIARRLTQEEPVWEITLHPASHFVLFCFFFLRMGRIKSRRKALYNEKYHLKNPSDVFCNKKRREGALKVPRVTRLKALFLHNPPLNVR